MIIANYASRKMKKILIIKFAAIISCLVISCATKEKSLSRIRINAAEIEKPSLSYRVLVDNSRVKGTSELFLLDVDLIEDKIFYHISSSDIFTPTSNTIKSSENKDEDTKERPTPDFHFSIEVGWGIYTKTDELIDSMRAGYMAGSFGLFPYTVSEEIVLNINVITIDGQSKQFHYEKPVTHLLWGPARLTAFAQEKDLSSKKFIPILEGLMQTFLKEFREEYLEN